MLPEQYYKLSAFSYRTFSPTHSATKYHTTQEIGTSEKFPTQCPTAARRRATDSAARQRPTADLKYSKWLHKGLMGNRLGWTKHGLARVAAVAAAVSHSPCMIFMVMSPSVLLHVHHVVNHQFEFWNKGIGRYSIRRKMHL